MIELAEAALFHYTAKGSVRLGAYEVIRRDSRGVRCARAPARNVIKITMTVRRLKTAFRSHEIHPLARRANGEVESGPPFRIHSREPWPTIY
jgi:hypothetical protein